MKPHRGRILAAAIALALIGGVLATDGFAGRAHAFTLIELQALTWYGPVGLTRGQTALFHYSNFAAEGTAPVQVEWAFSDAMTGELIVGNFGKPRPVAAMSGVTWDLDGDKVVLGDSMRRQLVGWLKVTHANKRSLRRAVNLSDIEVVDSATMRTTAMVMANPTAPGDRYLLRAAEEK